MPVPSPAQNDNSMAKKVVKKVKISPNTKSKGMYGSAAAEYSVYKKKSNTGSNTVQRSVVSKGV